MPTRLCNTSAPTSVLFFVGTLLVVVTEAAASPKPQRTLATWMGVGTKTSKTGMGGNDITEALEWVTKHKDHISSLSITGYGKGGAKNLTARDFNQALAGSQHSASTSSQ